MFLLFTEGSPRPAHESSSGKWGRAVPKTPAAAIGPGTLEPTADGYVPGPPPVLAVSAFLGRARWEGQGRGNPSPPAKALLLLFCLHRNALLVHWTLKLWSCAAHEACSLVPPLLQLWSGDYWAPEHIGLLGKMGTALILRTRGFCWVGSGHLWPCWPRFLVLVALACTPERALSPGTLEKVDSLPLKWHIVGSAEHRVGGKGEVGG